MTPAPFLTATARPRAWRAIALLTGMDAWNGDRIFDACFEQGDGAEIYAFVHHRFATHRADAAAMLQHSWQTGWGTKAAVDMVEPRTIAAARALLADTRSEDAARQRIALHLAAPLRPARDRAAAPVDGLALFDHVRSPTLL